MLSLFVPVSMAVNTLSNLETLAGQAKSCKPLTALNELLLVGSV